jgi:hypothetical protein
MCSVHCYVTGVEEGVQIRPKQKAVIQSVWSGEAVRFDMGGLKHG